MDTKTQKAVRALIQHFGGQTQTAEAIGVKQAAVSYWVNGNNGVSARSALKIERLTGGKIKAGDLCPDLAEFAD